MTDTVIPFDQVKWPAQPAASAAAPGASIPFDQVKWSSSQSAPASPIAPSRWDRVGAELMEPVLGLEQMAGRILPIPAYENGRWVSRAQADDDAVSRNNATIAAARGGNTGVNWEQIGLDTVNPVNYLGGPILKGARVAPEIAAPAMGALSALTEPVTGKNFWTEKSGQAALGAVAGKAGEKVANGIGKVIAPSLSGSSKVLSDLGVRLTPGQMAGGVAKATEDRASGFPFVGDMVKARRSEGVHDFNRAAINEGLSEIGQAIPKTVAAGRDAVNYMANAVKGELDRVTSQMTGHADAPFKSDLVNIVTMARNLPTELHSTLVRLIEHDIAPAFSQGGMISGTAAQDIGTKLDNLAGALGQSDDPDKRRLGAAVGEIDQSMNRMLERNNPALAAQKQRADAAYAHYKTIERAASMQGAEDGVFTPAHLLSSIRARDPSKDKASFARGNAMMQDLATHAQKVLPSKIPDSGTAGREALAGVGGLLAYDRPLAAAGAAAGLGLATGAYTKSAQAGVRRLVNPGATRKAVRAALDALGPRTAPAAAQAALGIEPSQKSIESFVNGFIPQ